MWQWCLTLHLGRSKRRFSQAFQRCSRPGVTSSKFSGVLTMKDMAALAGVSESTVSRALSDHPSIGRKTRERIQALALEHGYMVNPVARSLRSRQTFTIAVVVPLFHDQNQALSDPFFSTILGHLADAVAARGYDLLLSKVLGSHPGWVSRTVDMRRADAVIVLGQSHGEEAINEAARRGAPVVVWGAVSPGQAYSCVGSDNALGGRLATAHLLGKGRRHLAFFGDRRLPECAQRFQGFLTAHKASGVVWDDKRALDAHFDPDRAYREISQFLSTAGDLDGIVAASDLIAVTAMRVLRDQGREVPKDVAVVGYDDTPVAEHATPSLTTIRQDISLAAVRLVEIAINLANGLPAESEMLPVWLMERQSTA